MSLSNGISYIVTWQGRRLPSLFSLLASLLAPGTRGRIFNLEVPQDPNWFELLTLNCDNQYNLWMNPQPCSKTLTFLMISKNSLSAFMIGSSVSSSGAAFASPPLACMKWGSTFLSWFALVIVRLLHGGPSTNSRFKADVVVSYLPQAFEEERKLNTTKIKYRGKEKA